MPVSPQERPAPTTDARPRRTGRRLVAAGVGLAVLVPVAAHLSDRLPGFGDPFEQQVVDRSTEPLMLALEDLAEYHAAAGSFQVVVDREVDTPWVPSAISGERVSFLATGSVDASVDFSGLDDDRITLSPDGRSATVVLPAPELGEVRIDPEQSRVLDRDRGVLDRAADAVGDGSSDDGELYALAERRLAAAAAGSDLLDRAETNTRRMLTGLAGAFGVEDVEVRFEAAPRSAG